MKIQTMSVVIGTSACNAKCPFCVSKMTGSVDCPTKPNWKNFEKACRLAQIGEATTVLLTGKGEPTLYPELISDYIAKLKPFGFPFIELQTNGISLLNMEDHEDHLKTWYHHGLNTICLSAVHYEQEPNLVVYSPKYPRIEETVKKLHEIGFTVRLSIIMLKGDKIMGDCINTPKDINNLVKFCKRNQIKQLTIRPLAYPQIDIDDEMERAEFLHHNTVVEWTKKHTLEHDQLLDIQSHLNSRAVPILHLTHGAVVYDYDGQNICLTNCLTTNETDDSMRQIIFFPDGTIGYDWKYKGAVLL